MFTEAGHKMLHRARSLRKLRHQESPPHRRQVSDASDTSDASRASSSGSDTTQRERSVEWDSLRLHPSMEVDRSPHITPLHPHSRHHNQPSHGPTAEQQQSFSLPRHQLAVSLEIHDGFDFGFDKARTTSAPVGSAGRRLRAPKSEADLRPAAQAAAAKSAPTDWSAAMPSPTRRIHPRGFDEADYFIRRGGWKRRGIVFGSTDDAHESEDDCFDIP